MDFRAAFLFVCFSRVIVHPTSHLECLVPKEQFRCKTSADLVLRGVYLMWHVGTEWDDFNSS